MKVCTQCGFPKLECDFHCLKLGKDGLNPACKGCIGEYGRRHRVGYKDRHLELRELRKESLRSLVSSLKAGPCFDCGRCFIPEGMHFDHRPGESKITNVCRMIDSVKSEKHILHEIAKCDLVCVGCHRLRGASRIFIMDHYHCPDHVSYEKLCYPCRQRDCQRMKKNRAKSFVESLKKAPCSDCGHFYEPILMDFDHRPDTDKAASLALACSRGWGLKKLAGEIAKCDLVCCWCHVDRTVSRRISRAA